MGLLKIKVVHLKKEAYDVYIGRPSIYGNPWSHNSFSKADFIVSTRKEAVDNYKKWLKGKDFKNILQEKRREILQSFPELKGKVLGCWCAPKLCHGHVLIELIEGISRPKKLEITNLF